MLKKKVRYLILTGFLILFILGYLIVSSPAYKHKQLPCHQVGDVPLLAATTIIKQTPKFNFTVAVATEKKLTLMIKQMSLEEKVGQLFLARVPAQNQLTDIQKYHLGGYLLFSRDLLGETPTSLKEKIASYQAVADLPLMIASDEEGGSVSRLSYEKGLLATPFESPQTLFKRGGLTEINKNLHYKAEVLQQLGISMSLAPVADVATDPKAFIYERTLGQDVATTATYIAETVKEMSKLKLGSTLKHFPGYGNNGDSHLDLVYDERTLTQLEKEALPPFIKGIEAGADSVLVTHNIVTALDKEAPASLSPQVYKLLRTDLGFKGVIMTDDFDMAGLSKYTSQAKAALTAFKSGADLVLSSSYQQQIPVVVDAVTNGELAEELIDASLLRVLTLKHHLGLPIN